MSQEKLLQLFDQASQRQQQGDLEGAAALYQEMIPLAPDHPEIHYNLANILRLRGKTDDAATGYQKVLALQPNHAAAAINLGALCWTKGQLSLAASYFEKVVAIQPDNAEAHNNLGCVLRSRGLVTQSLGHFLRATELRPSYHAAWSNYLFALNYLPNLSPEEIFERHKSFSPCCHPELKAKDLTASAISGRSFANAQDDKPGRKIKVGYLSPDFRNHSVAYFIEPILAHHDHDQFEIFCYADVPHPDQTSARLKNLVPHWHDTHRLSDPELFSLISSHQLDILVDLAGHTAGNRLPLFAAKPAPIQVSYLGYPNTTGLSSIDYRLTDALADPPGAEAFHTEQLIRLPNGFLCYQPPHNAPQVNPLPALKNGFVTFGSCNTLAKTNSEVISLWTQILNACPGSKLLLKNNSFADPPTLQHYQKLFSDRGIDPHRLLFLPWLKEDHLAIYHQIDIALDPFPYNGTTTTCEALWMGVPVITLSGNRHASRVGNSILHQIGWTEGVAKTARHYQENALQLVSHLEQLSPLRNSFRSKIINSPLTQRNGFLSSLETSYRTMLEKLKTDQ